METSPLIFGANQWTGFYMITASVMIEFSTMLLKESPPGQQFFLHVLNNGDFNIKYLVNLSSSSYFHCYYYYFFLVFWYVFFAISIMKRKGDNT